MFKGNVCKLCTVYAILCTIINRFRGLDCVHDLILSFLLVVVAFFSILSVVIVR